MPLMLEDAAARVRRFKTALDTIDPDLRLLVWRDARAMTREVAPLGDDWRRLVKRLLRRPAAPGI